MIWKRATTAIIMIIIIIITPNTNHRRLLNPIFVWWWILLISVRLFINRWLKKKKEKKQQQKSVFKFIENEKFAQIIIATKWQNSVVVQIPNFYQFWKIEGTDIPYTPYSSEHFIHTFAHMQSPFYTITHTHTHTPHTHHNLRFN